MYHFKIACSVNTSSRERRERGRRERGRMERKKELKTMN